MDIVIERGKQVEFKDLPEYTLALDGFCDDGPQIDMIRHVLNLNHHKGCLRFCTLATIAQMHTLILLGFDPSLYTARINDLDIDTCGAIWCGLNPDKCTNPLAMKLVDAISKGDMHLGAIPLNGMAKVVEWVSAPETDSKKSGDYGKLSNSGLQSLLEAILHRIDLYVDGEASVEVSKYHKHDDDYKILRNENDWVLVQSYDPHIYSKLFQAGFERIVLVRPQEDGSNAVSFAKKSDIVEGFPLEKIYEKVNELEPGCGGGTTVGACVRNSDGSRSKLPISKWIEIIDSVVKEN